MNLKHAGFFIAFTASFLGGCAGVQTAPSSPVATQAAPAAELTLMEAPADTARYYYAVGEGDSTELAKNRALAEIAAKISVSVSASLSNELTVTTNDDKTRTSERTDSKVNAIAKTIDFSDVSVERTQTRGGMKYVLVKVDRDHLLQGQLRKVQGTDDKIVKEMGIFDKSEIFYRLKLSYNIERLVNEAREQLTLLRAMKPGYDDSAFQNRYTAYEGKIREAKQQAVFAISADSNSRSLALLIKRFLSEENIRMSEHGGNVKLDLTTSAEEKSFKTTNVKLKNMKMVARTTSLKVRNTSGVVISNNVIRTKATSPVGVDDAIQQTRQYEDLIQKSGILSFISGNE
ncbi:MAG: LPP20 family lipoprotein [Hahellaceae bacterium]|nr:LPP20 family lipoprotein [Hahellaceae bacterium]